MKIYELLDLHEVRARRIRLKDEAVRGIRLELQWSHGLVSGSDWLLN